MSQNAPNIIFIMSDDHAAHAMSCYGSKINKTPNLDRIADGGIRFDNCFCTNSICTPSRATILTGTYNHINDVTTLASKMDNRLDTYPKHLQKAGYQTAIFGKWHLGEGPDHCPTGFDDWAVVPGQGYYHNPNFFFKNDEGGELRTVKGYATDLITDMSLDWLKDRDRSRPFCLMTHHKAPHRPWEPDEAHAHLYLNEDIPEPDTLYDDYATRSTAAHQAEMRVGVHMEALDTKCGLNKNLNEMELRKWAYQFYIKDYLRVIASIDDNVGRLLDYLEDEGIADNTIVVYTSDQGFFLGDHGWYDKRFMYEESLRMPFILRYPDKVAPGSVSQSMALNLDFAPTFLDLAGLPIPEEMQGRSMRPLLEGETPADWRKDMYYRYWMHRGGGHNVFAHYGLRTERYKLICYYADGLDQPGTLDESNPVEWELFDLKSDPCELNNLYGQPDMQPLIAELKQRLDEIQREVGDQPYEGA